MLKQDQAAELLLRCERLLGRRLEQIRGNLKTARSRAAAVWELLCIDAFAQLGALDHEPPGESAPDIVLHGVGAPPIWIEAAYLYPRSWENDRRAEDLLKWIYLEAARRNIPAVRISSRFFGEGGNPKGPIRTLPRQHEKAKVLNSEPLRTFFAAIASRPHAAHSTTLDPYSVALAYDPGAQGPYVHSSGIVEEQPTTVQEHALYRVLDEKTRQHKPDCGYIVCVGTDQSRAISRYGMPYGVTEKTALAEIFRVRPKVSAVIVVGIETPSAVDHDYRPVAYSRLYENPNAIRPLNASQTQALLRLNFNRWRYYFALEKWELTDDAHFHHSGGLLGVSTRDETISLTIPSTTLMDCLAGKTSLQKEYPDRPGESLLRCVAEGWEIVGCSFADGSIEQGEANRVTLVLAPPPDRVFGMG